MDEKLLCPMLKHTKTETYKSQVRDVRNADWATMYFGDCIKNSCAWWRDDGRCAVLNIADALETIATK